MSTSRLCTRISKCSRLSLSLNGDRITQNRCRSVGSGTGPLIVALVRRTVSTILRRRLVDDLVIVGPQAYPNALSSCHEVLLVDLRDRAGADSAATFTDGETKTFVHGDRCDQLHLHHGVVTGHAHLDALLQGDRAGDVGGAEVELRPVVREERLVAATFVLRQVRRPAHRTRCAG